MDNGGNAITDIEQKINSSIVFKDLTDNYSTRQ